MEQRAWLTPREAAQLLGIPLQDLYRLVDDGDLTAVRQGRLVRVRPGDVDACRDPPDDPPRAPVPA